MSFGFVWVEMLGCDTIEKELVYGNLVKVYTGLFPARLCTHTT
jgi:hypothetical protein